ncbi:sel1 repeat family protein [Pelomyxa schiedti]|nr:sel1 repeat family protein [Pelomyxa schiedti]
MFRFRVRLCHFAAGGFNVGVEGHVKLTWDNTQNFKTESAKLEIFTQWAFEQTFYYEVTRLDLLTQKSLNLALCNSQDTILGSCALDLLTVAIGPSHLCLPCSTPGNSTGACSIEADVEMELLSEIVIGFLNVSANPKDMTVEPALDDVKQNKKLPPCPQWSWPQLEPLKVQNSLHGLASESIIFKLKNPKTGADLGTSVASIDQILTKYGSPAVCHFICDLVSGTCKLEGDMTFGNLPFISQRKGGINRGMKSPLDGEPFLIGLPDPQSVLNVQVPAQVAIPVTPSQSSFPPMNTQTPVSSHPSPNVSATNVPTPQTTVQAQPLQNPASIQSSPLVPQMVLATQNSTFPQQVQAPIFPQQPQQISTVSQPPTQTSTFPQPQQTPPFLTPTSTFPQPTPGIVYEVKCIGEGHPEFFRDQSYVLKVPFNYGVHTSSVSNAFENEYLVLSTLDPHPNVNQYFCHFTDRLPQEYYDLLPPVPKEMALDKMRNRFHACVWIVLEYHSETLDHFLKNLHQPTGTQSLTATPWCVVHKYSRDICAGLVHLLTSQTIHFDMKLDNIVVSSNKEQAIVIDLGCAKKFPNRSLERETVYFGTVGNQLHLAPEILNGIALHIQHPDRCPSLPCEKQPSFELGCILFELAMRGQHPLPGYPAAYGPTGQIVFSVESEGQFPMRPPAFPREFCNLVRSLLEYDPTKRIPLMEAFNLLETLMPEPNPWQLLSFYTFIVPSNAGTLTTKALCQIMTGDSTTKDCVDTLHQALEIEPFFSPALLILHYLLPSGGQQGLTSMLDHVTRKRICAIVSGQALFTHTDLEFERAINQSHRISLPELVLSAIRMRHICNISFDEHPIKNCIKLLQGKASTLDLTRSEQPSNYRAPASVFLKNIIDSCSEDRYKRMWSDQLTTCTYEQPPRSKLMLQALLEFEQVNIEMAIHLVSDAFEQFESCHRRVASQLQIQEELCYLPGLLFLYSLRFFADDHVALHQLIPPNLSTAFSYAISSPISEMRDYCQRVACLSPDQSEEKVEEMMSITKEWDGLIASVSIIGQGQKQGVCEYFVALWTACCLEKPSCGLLQMVGCMAHKEPTTLWHSPMMSLIGACILGGDGVDRDPSKAVSLLQQAADAGNTSAMNGLGFCYSNGNGVNKDMNQAVSLYRRASDAGNVTAMSNLGVCYQNGNGVDKDMNQAVSLYRRASEAGNAKAMYNLGLCYQDGNGVNKDMNQALSFYWRASEAGNVLATLHLGCCYQNGTGVEKDVGVGKTLVQRAVAVGCSAALRILTP